MKLDQNKIYNMFLKDTNVDRLQKSPTTQRGRDFAVMLASLDDLGKFNLITVFEVFEHVPDINVLMKNLTQLMSDDCLVLFSTLVSDGNLKLNNRINWWYASPRNGHISLFSKQALTLLGSKYTLKFGSFSDGFHCYFRQVPGWAKHIF